MVAYTICNYVRFKKKKIHGHTKFKKFVRINLEFLYLKAEYIYPLNSRLFSNKTLFLSETKLMPNTCYTFFKRETLYFLFPPNRFLDSNLSYFTKPRNRKELFLKHE